MKATKDAGGSADPKSVRDSQILELLLDATTDGVMDWDLVSGAVHYTARWKLLLGYEEDALADTPTLWSELSHTEDLPRVQEAFADHIENFWPFTQTWRMKHANGEWRWVLCRAVTSRSPEGSPLRLVGVFSDITDRIRAEDRHRALGAAIPDLLLRVGGDGMLLDVKPPAYDPPPGLSWPLSGQSLSLWPPARDWYQRVITMIREGAPVTGFEAALGTDGARRFADVRVVASGADEALCIVRDVTEQRQLEAQLMQAHKLESIGQLAAGIAHEINTPMQFIGDNLTFLKEVCVSLLSLIEAQQNTLAAVADRPISEDEVSEIARVREDVDFDYLAEKGPRAVEAALDGVKRVAHIVSAMKEFSHPGKVEKSMADLNRELETTITISMNVWKYVADIERDFDPRLPPVPCHPGEINQVVLNLIVNAAHAIGDVTDNGARGKGVIKVSTGRKDAFVEIRVSDTGTGIPEKVRQRIFDPFFTTKEVGRGTGQGLAIARTTVVDKHRGAIDVETEVGKGTTFIVRLPLAASE
jgi:two-component system, NtrC family, sensor kinase